MGSLVNESLVNVVLCLQMFCIVFTLFYCSGFNLHMWSNSKL